MWQINHQDLLTCSRVEWNPMHKVLRCMNSAFWRALEMEKGRAVSERTHVDQI